LILSSLRATKKEAHISTKKRSGPSRAAFGVSKIRRRRGEPSGFSGRGAPLWHVNIAVHKTIVKLYSARAGMSMCRELISMTIARGMLKAIATHIAQGQRMY
jgi:hypothetical protein